MIKKAKTEKASEHKHTNGPDLSCVYCGRPPHPDNYGHSYRPQEGIDAPAPSPQPVSMNLNDIRDKTVNMIACGINHDLSPDDEEYVKGQVDWALRQAVWKQIKSESQPVSQQQWTAASVAQMLGCARDVDFKKVATAINAALKAERDKLPVIEAELQRLGKIEDLYLQQCEQLAAERKWTQEVADKILASNTALDAERAKAERLAEDKRRLDWLSEHLDEMALWMQTFGKDWKETLREAIDKASALAEMEQKNVAGSSPAHADRMHGRRIHGKNA